MRITLPGREPLEIEAPAGSYVKIWQVPEDYSADGIYAGIWRHGECEPAPACLGCHARLLAFGAIRADETGAAVFSGQTAEGIICR